MGYCTYTDIAVKHSFGSESVTVRFFSPRREVRDACSRYIQTMSIHLPNCNWMEIVSVETNALVHVSKNAFTR